MKKCKRCLSEKPLTAFRADPRYKDGFGSWCIECHRQRNSEWAKQNRERLSQKASDWRASNLELAREVNRNFKNRNKAKLQEDHAAWSKVNADKRRASTSKRKAAKLRAVPKWANPKAIAAIYKEAARREGRWHVDHIVPLQSPLVSGLHCEANLQIIPASDNESKRNFWWPQMFEDAQRQGDMFIGAAA
jgi:hypothetical protein